MIRHAASHDAFSLCHLLNEIIAIGGTTAIETPLSVAEFEDHFLTGPGCIVCFAAEASNGALLGFQCLLQNPDLPSAWADIATFSRRTPRQPGVGTALFQNTLAFARQTGIIAINATIRTDNHSGLPFYEKIGFKTHAVVKDIPLKDGTPMDRISKTYLLTEELSDACTGFPPAAAKTS